MGPQATILGLPGPATADAAAWLAYLSRTRRLRRVPRFGGVDDAGLDLIVTVFSRAFILNHSAADTAAATSAAAIRPRFAVAHGARV